MGVLVVMQVRLLVVLVVEVVQPQMEGMQRVAVLVLAVLVNWFRLRLLRDHLLVILQEVVVVGPLLHYLTVAEELEEEEREAQRLLQELLILEVEVLVQLLQQQEERVGQELL
jgi:hypothetical protein